MKIIKKLLLIGLLAGVSLTGAPTCDDIPPIKRPPVADVPGSIIYEICDEEWFGPRMKGLEVCATKQKVYIEKLEKELACYKCEESQRQNNAKPKVLDFRVPESWIINKPYAIRSVCQDMDNGLKEVVFFIRNKGDSVWEPFLADRKHSLSGTEDFVTLYHRMKETGSYEIRVSCWDADYHDEDNKRVSFEVVEAPEPDVYEY